MEPTGWWCSAEHHWWTGGRGLTVEIDGRARRDVDEIVVFTGADGAWWRLFQRSQDGRETFGTYRPSRLRVLDDDDPASRAHAGLAYLRGVASRLPSGDPLQAVYRTLDSVPSGSALERYLSAEPIVDHGPVSPLIFPFRRNLSQWRAVLLYDEYSSSLQSLRLRLGDGSRHRSENIAHALLSGVLAEDRYSSLKVAQQVLVRNVLTDLRGLTARQAELVRQHASLDFVVLNRVTRQWLLAIEVDGFAHHEDDPVQLARDRLKDHILSEHGLPLLRLPTTGSGEEARLRSALDAALLAT